MSETKAFTISKQLFVEAFKEVKANAGAAGIDKQSIQDFEKNLKNHLYKLWNRMSSGSYFPPAVKAVAIPKKTGGERILGIPTVGDRICQAVVKQIFEPMVETYFLPDSYGYRPNKSALDAVGVTRERCWKYDWVLEFDIKSLFDNIPHDLLMKAVQKHTQEKWVILYIERWLKTPMQLPNNFLQEKTKGVMQGGVISPVLSNLFLHYVFDTWMQRHYPSVPWCRFADDGLAHCKTEQEAQKLLKVVQKRFAECGLELNLEKTKIVYCKDGKRKRKYPNESFDFLGYTFRARRSWSTKSESVFLNFTPGVSRRAQKSMRMTIKKSNMRNRADLSIEEIAKWFNPILSGWLNYYGAYNRSEMNTIWRHFNKSLIAWSMDKYKKLRKRKTRGTEFLLKIKEMKPNLFVHWKTEMVGSFF